MVYIFYCTVIVAKYMMTYSIYGHHLSLSFKMVLELNVKQV